MRAQSDSQVVVIQVNHEYVIHLDNLKAYAYKANRLNFQYFELIKISRDENEEADKLAKITSGETPNDDRIEVELPNSGHLVLPLQQTEQVGPSWEDKIKVYIIHDVLPNDNVKARQIRSRATRYLVLNDTLYRRSFTKSLLRCIPPNLTIQVQEKMHEEIYEGTSRPTDLVKKYDKPRYYWMTLRSDAER